MQQQEMLDDYGRIIAVIHYTHEDEDGRMVVACVPSLRDLSPARRDHNWQRSNDPVAVTCPNCKKTTAYENHGKRRS